MSRDETKLTDYEITVFKKFYYEALYNYRKTSNLLKKIIEVDLVDIDQDMLYYTLKSAIEENDRDFVEFLVSKGANCNPIDRHETPLHIAVFNKNIELIKYFIENGADVNEHDGFLLADVAQIGEVEILKILIDAGANLTAQNEALRIAKEFEHTEVVNMLIAAGAS